MPNDLVVTRERQLTCQLDFRRLEVVDTFWKICRVEVGIVIYDIQGRDVGLNISEVDVVPTVADVARNTNCATPVRVLTRVTVYFLEDRRGEATEGVQDLAVLLSPKVGVVIHAVAGVLTHTDGVTAFRIGFSTNGLQDWLLAVRTHVFDHALGCGSLLTVRLVTNGESLVFRNTLVGKNRGVNLSSLHRLIALPLVKRTSLITVRATLCIAPNTAVVGITWCLRSFRLVPAFLIHGEVRAHHVGVLRNARSTLLQEDTSALHVVVLKVERTVCGALRNRRPRTRHTAASLANIGQIIAGFRVPQRGINPNAVLLTTEGAEQVRLTVHIDERVLTARDFTIRVGEHIALRILSAKVKDVVA